MPCPGEDWLDLSAAQRAVIPQGISLELLGSASASPGGARAVCLSRESWWWDCLDGSHSGDSSFPQGHTRPGPTKTWLISGASFIPKAHHRLPCREAIFEGSGRDSTEQKCEVSALSHSHGSCP